MAAVTDGRSTELDESAISLRLASIGSAGVSAFSVSCAEHLYPLYEYRAEILQDGNPMVLRSALDLAWNNTARLNSNISALEEAYDTIQGLVLDDDAAPWDPLDPLAQNAVGALLYALRYIQGSNIQDGLWAARQVIEAADYLNQSVLPDHTYSLLAGASEPATLLAQALMDSLARCSAVDVDSEQVRSEAVENGMRFLMKLKNLRDP